MELDALAAARGARPEVDAGVGRVAVDLGELVVGEVELRERSESESSSCATLEAPTSVEVMRGSRSVHASASCASDLAAPLRELVRARGSSPASPRSAGPARASVFAAAREPAGIPSRYLSVSIPCASGEKPMQPTPSSPSASSRLGLDPAVEQRVRRLVDQERRAERRAGSPPPRASSPASTTRCPRRAPCPADGGVERAHRLLERRLGIEAVRVEDVDVVEPHPRERLVERCEQVLARAPLAVRPGPHVVAGLRRDHELVAVRAQVVAQHAAERLLGRAVRRAVVVREVEMGDAEVERAAEDRAARLERAVAAEVVPEPERDRGQLEAARPQRR